MRLAIKNLALVLLLLSSAIAQEREPKSDCEVVARINGDVITKVEYSDALKEHREYLSQQNKSEAEIDAEFERSKQSVLDQMIADILLGQRAKAIGLEYDAEIDKVIENSARPIRPGYDDSLTQAEVEEALRERGIDPEDARAVRRQSALQHYAIQKEVLEPIFRSITDEDRLAYYNAHKEEFIIPGKAALSEIYLPFEGGSEIVAEMRALDLLADLRRGADFVKAVKENVPESRSSYANEGRLGSYAAKDLREEIAAAIAKLKPGEFTEPLQATDGYMIIRLDNRIPATQRNYDDPEVRRSLLMTITLSRAEVARKDYIARLREKAYIEICSLK